MSNQLDILALEPFYGGARRHMLETVLRCSRHRWTLLKLPPRRMERRLAVAASWFAEQLSRHWSGRVDVLFTSEAMNLASLYRLVPAVAGLPSVVYFHENQMTGVGPAAASAHGRANAAPAPGSSQLPSDAITRAIAPPLVAPPTQAHEVDVELVNLNTAAAATEIWFNSSYHLHSFMAAVTQLVARHQELSARNPMAQLSAKAFVVPPPIDLNLVPHVIAQGKVPLRDPRAIFVDTRNAHLRILNAALAELASRGEQFRLITVGPVEDLSPIWPRRTISEVDDAAHVQGLLECGVVLSVRPGAGCDLQVVRGLQAGCRPLLPREGMYSDLLPPHLHEYCLYDFNVDGLSNQLQDAINPLVPWSPPDLRAVLKQFEAIAATRLFDERLSHLAAGHATR